MSAYDAAAWQNFYVMVGGAAAALTGLLFVAMSLHSKAIIAHPLHGTRAVGTLLSLHDTAFRRWDGSDSAVHNGARHRGRGGGAPVRHPDGEGSCGHPGNRRTPGSIAHETTLEGIGAAIWIVLFVASGISLIAHAGGGLFLLAAVMPFMFGWNVYVAWVLITEITD